MRQNTLRVLGLGALIVGQGLWLGNRFDSASLALLPHGWWSGILGFTGQVMPVAAVLATGFLLLSSSRLRQSLPPRSLDRDPRGLFTFLTLELAAYAALFLISRQLFGLSPAVTRHPGVWVLAWLAASFATAVFWLAALVPLATIQWVLRRMGGLLAACVAVSLIAWRIGLYTRNWWLLLRASTLQGAYAVLHLFDPTAQVDSTRFLIGAGGNFVVEVNRQCSGYEGIGLIWVFLIAFFWICRRDLRFPRALLLLPLATAATWIVNTLRIASLVAIGAHLSPGIALGGFHSFAGILLVSAVALSFGAAGTRMSYFAAHPHMDEPDDLSPNRRRATGESLAHSPRAITPLPTTNPAAPWLVPFLVTMATGMVTGLFSAGGLDPLYPLRVLVAGLILWHYRAAYRQSASTRADHTPAATITLAAPLAGTLVFAVWLAWLLHVGSPAAMATLALSGPLRIIWIIFRAGGSIVIAPIVEEFAFRGYLARRCMRADFDSVPLNRLNEPAILLSSLAFAAVHHGLFAPALAAGIVYAWIARRRGRIGDAIVAHATTNALLTLCALFGNHWWMWS